MDMKKTANYWFWATLITSILLYTLPELFQEIFEGFFFLFLFAVSTMIFLSTAMYKIQHLSILKKYLIFGTIFLSAGIFFSLFLISTGFDLEGLLYTIFFLFSGAYIFRGAYNEYNIYRKCSIITNAKITKVSLQNTVVPISLDNRNFSNVEVKIFFIEYYHQGIQINNILSESRINIDAPLKENDSIQIKYNPEKPTKFIFIKKNV